MGLGWETLHAWHPGLILARISGWGQTGPDAARPGFGTLVEAASGFAAMNGEADGAPIVPSFPLADMTAALYTSNAILVALHHRDQHGGGGQCLDISLFESLFSVLGPLPAEYAATGRVRTRSGSRSRNSGPRGCYETRDGQWLAVSGSTPRMAERFLTAYGLSELLDDPRFATNEARVAHALEVDAVVSSAIGSRTLAENIAIVDAHALTAVPVQTVAEIERDPHWRARGLLVDVESSAGPVRMHDVVPRFSGTPGRVERVGGDLGADNAAFYAAELGLSSDELAQLAARGVI
jgi:crotonobetainyl-CoA:carnitine CoA-transferase CaiB-like acyl-CoA transferase